ncbi:Chromate resistance protein ChrB [Pseudoroseomonas wenyumeiae]
MGAVYLQSGLCLLPRTEEHTRRLKMLENDVAQAGGEAVILETAALDRLQEEKVLARFRADRNEAYREFLEKCADMEAEIAKERAANKFSYAELEENEVDLKKLRGWLAKITRLDFYGAPSRPRRRSDCAPAKRCSTPMPAKSSMHMTRTDKRA